jgi:hypothetical protein
LKSTPYKNMGRLSYECPAESPMQARQGLELKKGPHAISRVYEGSISPSQQNPPCPPLEKGGKEPVGLGEIAPCAASGAHSGWQRCLRLLLFCFPLSVAALVVAGCMIPAQSLLQNSQQAGAAERLIRPVIPDEAKDNLVASGPTFAPTSHPKQPGSTSPEASDKPVSMVSQQPDASARANGQSNEVPQQPRHSVKSPAQPAPRIHRPLAFSRPGDDSNPDVARPDASVQARHQATAIPGLRTRTTHAKDGGSQSELARAPEAPARSGAKPDASPASVAKSAAKEAVQSTHPTSSAKEARQKSDETEWEDQKVKRAAMELRDAHRSAQKMKLCYAVKDDEWWVTFYEDAASHYDLKQYVWDRDRECLDPFLVMKSIPKDRLHQDLHDGEPDRACEVINLPPPSQKEGEGLNENF